MNRLIAALAVSTGLAVAGSAAQAQTAVPSDARVYIIWPKDGRVINGGKLWLRMGARNVGIAPAGVVKSNTGHHHLIINTELPPLDEEIPNDPNHRHFGAGQSEVRLEFPPGEHTLQMLMGDAAHVPHNPPLMSERITIIVPQ